MRKKQGFTQDMMADLLHMDVSCYCRRESGQIKILPKQWLKIAETLGVPIEEIYQSDDELASVLDRKYSMSNERIVGQYSLPDEVLGMYHKHIEVLEMELGRLKELLKLAAQ
jgi:DNA-binding XRE family transcriptional regulator